MKINQRVKTFRLVGIFVGWILGFVFQKICTFDIFDYNDWIFYITGLIFALVQYGLIAIAKQYKASLLLKCMAIVYGYVLLIQLDILIQNWVTTGKLDALWFFDIGLIAIGLVLCLLFKKTLKDTKQHSTSVLYELALSVVLLVQHICMFQSTGYILICVCLLIQCVILYRLEHVTVYRILCWIFVGLTALWNLTLLLNNILSGLSITCLVFDCIIALLWTRPGYSFNDVKADGIL